MYEMFSQVANNETSPSVMMSLPDDLIMDIIARISRFNYADLSLVCKKFRFLISLTDELYKRRSLLGSTEYCMYVNVLEIENNVTRWYILNRKNKTNMLGLAPILSLPPMPVWASYDVVGSNIFVMGGVYDRFNWPPVPSSTALCIDCRTHVARHVANMPITLSGILRSKVINEKINVIGKSVDEPSYAPESRIIMVFDTRTETWEHGTKPVSEKDPRWFKSFPPTSDEHHIDAKENKWDTDEILHYKYHGCVIDDIMYRYKRDKNILITYDLKQRIWGEVKGLEKLPLISSHSKMISCGKKLILFVEKGVQKREIWCAEITVERREGEIWGKIECYDLLLDGCFCFFDCLAVPV